MLLAARSSSQTDKTVVTAFSSWRLENLLHFLSQRNHNRRIISSKEGIDIGLLKKPIIASAISRAKNLIELASRIEHLKGLL